MTALFSTLFSTKKIALAAALGLGLAACSATTDKKSPSHSAQTAGQQDVALVVPADVGAIQYDHAKHGPLVDGGNVVLRSTERDTVAVFHRRGSKCGDPAPAFVGRTTPNGRLVSLGTVTRQSGSCGIAVEFLVVGYQPNPGFGGTEEVKFGRSTANINVYR